MHFRQSAMRVHALLAPQAPQDLVVDPPRHGSTVAGIRDPAFDPEDWIATSVLADCWGWANQANDNSSFLKNNNVPAPAISAAAQTIILSVPIVRSENLNGGRLGGAISGAAAAKSSSSAISAEYPRAAQPANWVAQKYQRNAHGASEA